MLTHITFTKNKKSLIAKYSVLAGTALLACSPVWAQPEAPGGEQKWWEEQRKQMEGLTPEQRQEFRQQQWQERLKAMTPEQRAQFEGRRAQMEQFQRQQKIAATSADDRQRFLMKSAGINDVAEQDAILAFSAELAEHRKPVTEAATQLSTLLGDAEATPDALSTQLAKLQTASKDFRAWQEGALKALDVKANFSTNPRLLSLLTLVGIISDESYDAGGFNAIFPKGVAGSGDIVDLLPKTENNNFGGWGGFGGGR